mgnify:FL=1
MSHIINYRLNQLSWAIAALLLLPLLFTKGMFFDGLTYATIASHLNDGVGTFWSPSYTPYIHPEFYEHPPFSFALHSIFYRLFGDQFWVDRIYPYIMYGLSVLMMRRIWVLFIPAGHRAWIPQLLWTLTPTVIWVHQNNLLEAPLSAAVLCVVWLLFEGTIKKNYFWSSLAGVLLFLGLGIKGPVALFPLMTLPILAVLFPEHRKASLISMLVMVLSFSFIFSYFYVYQPGFSAFFEKYLDRQLIPTLLGEREKSGGLWSSLLQVGKQLVLPVVVLIVLRIRSGKAYQLKKESTFFFLLALCGTIPFLFMDRQHHYYFMPAMAYWMLGFAILLEQRPYPWSIQRKKWVKFISLGNMALWFVAISLSVFFSKSPSRDKHMIKAVELIHEKYPDEPVQIKKLSEEWKLSAVAARYGKLELTEKETGLYLVREGQQPPASYEEVLSFKKFPYHLYEKTAQP